MQPQVQILGLRSFFSVEKQKDIVFDSFFEKKWRAPSVADLFENIESYLEKIPEKERWNLYYTTATCLEEKGRKMVEQTVMPFDIDKIEINRRLEYVPVVLKALGLEHDQTGIVFSGNGLQFIVGLVRGFTSVDYFDQNRLHYKALVEKINRALSAAGLPGEADPSVFSAARLMRLPLTLNRKKDKPERQGELIQRKIVPVDFDITVASGLPKVASEDHINPQTLKRYPTPDTPAVLDGCNFLKHCKDDPAKVSEAEWYAMLSVTARLANGNQLSHDLSSGHPGYSHAETEAKIEQALQASGPRTCANIQKLWSKCESCPHFGKVNSPIMIRGENYIATESTGFWIWKELKTGVMVPHKPAYEDLRKYFEKKNDYKVMLDSGICYIWNGKYYEEYLDRSIKAFAQENFKPAPDEAMRSEFLRLVTVTNLVPKSWFENTTHRKMNFNNGVLDLDTMNFLPHSKEYGFTHVLPYDYDPKAQAPRFERFMQEVTGSRQDLVNILMEYAGYAFSNDSCWTGKCLIMTGEGSNGKSTWMNVLKALAGEKNVSSLTLTDIKSEVQREALDGKLFNMAEETPVYSTIENTTFKALVTGGTTQVKKLYKQPYSIRNRCKFIFACNELPRAKDTTHGYFRRLLIVPFTQEFKEGSSNYDPFLEETLMKELPGIFNLVIRGYHQLKKARRFSQSEVTAKALEDYKLEIDTVKQWVEDQLELIPLPTERHSAIEDLYDSYKFFTDRRNHDPLEFIPFTKALARNIERYPERKKRKKDKGARSTILLGVVAPTQTNF